MPSESQIRAQIAIILASVPGVGVVHTRGRAASDPEQLRTLLRYSDTETRGCVIRYLGFTERPDSELGMVERAIRYRIDFAETFDDTRSDGTSSTDFLVAQIEACATAFRTALSLGFGTDAVRHRYLQLAEDVYLVDSDPGGKLHVARCRLDVAVWVATTEC